MFSNVRLYNSACSYSTIPIRVYPILMSITLHHYNILKEKNFDMHYSDFDYINNTSSSNNNNIILKREIDKWNNFFLCFKKTKSKKL